MDVFSYIELGTGLLSVVGVGILILAAMSRPPKALCDEIALRVAQSIDVLDRCKDTPSR
jgi:hypothetical protein